MSLDFIFEPAVETQVVTVKQQFINDVNFDGLTNSFSQYPKISLNTYSDPTDQFEFVPKIYTDNTFLTQADATSTYLTQASASSTYLPTATASSTYLSQADATSTYLTQATASSTYLPSATASSTYLSQADATTALALKATESFVTTSISTAINNLINSAPSTLDTLGEIATILQSNVNDISTITTSIAGKVSKTANETITGIFTYSEPPVMSGASIASGTIADASLASTFLKTSDASSTYLTQLNASSTYQTQSATTTSLALKANLASPQLTGVPTAPTASTSDNSTQLATTAYVKSNLSAYEPTLSASSNVSIGTLITTSLTENLISVTPSSNVYTIDFSQGNNFFSASNPSTNFTVNITNIPTTTTRQYTINLLVNTGTYFCSTASATDTSSATVVASATPKNAWGISPVISAFTTVAIHTFTVIPCFGTKYIIYSASTFY